jgi:hypothetical protein
VAFCPLPGSTRRTPAELLRRTPLLTFLRVLYRADYAPLVPVLETQLPHLRTLHLDELTETQAAPFAWMPRLPPRLVLWSVGPGVVRTITSGPARRNLRSLEVRASTVDQTDLLALTSLDDLQELALLYGEVAETDVLLRAAKFPSLRHLDLEVIDETLFAASSFLPQLEKLRLLQPTSMETLRRATALADLTLLGDVKCDAADLRHLAALGLPLRALSLSGRLLDRDGLAVLVGMGLEKLDVGGNPLASGLAALWLPAAASLRTLILSSIWLTADDAALLASSPHLSGIETLHLEHNRLGAEGWRKLIASPHLRPRRIVLDHPGDEEVIAAGKARFGDALVHGAVQ